MMPICRRCLILQLDVEFYRDRRDKTGRRRICRTCVRRAKHPLTAAELAAKRDYMRLYQKTPAQRAYHRAYFKVWAAANPERILATRLRTKARKLAARAVTADVDNRIETS